jgi:putative transposase
VKYACLHTHRQAFDVALMCRVLRVSRAGFYAAQQRQKRERAYAEERLRLEIRTSHRQSPQRYGSPRVHEELNAPGIRCGQKCGARLMRAEGLRAKQRRHFRTTTDAKPRHPLAPPVLQRRFNVEEIAGVDRVWGGDLTDVPTQGWLDLAVVLDLATRRVVGWAMQTTLWPACSPRMPSRWRSGGGVPSQGYCITRIEGCRMRARSTRRFSSRMASRLA